MFDSLSIKLEKAFQTLKGQGRITEINVASTIKEIRKALIDADVNYKVAKDVTDEIKEKAIGQNVLTAISPGQLLTKITSDELTLLMGGESEDIKIDGNPAVILIAGLQGSGKTTFSGKLASYLKRQGRSVLLTACDIYRPAAIDQLKVLGRPSFRWSSACSSRAHAAPGTDTSLRRLSSGRTDRLAGRSHFRSASARRTDLPGS